MNGMKMLCRDGHVWALYQLGPCVCGGVIRGPAETPEYGLHNGGLLGTETLPEKKGGKKSEWVKHPSPGVIIPGQLSMAVSEYLKAAEIAMLSASLPRGYDISRNTRASPR